MLELMLAFTKVSLCHSSASSLRHFGSSWHSKSFGALNPFLDLFIAGYVRCSLHATLRTVNGSLLPTMDSDTLSQRSLKALVSRQSFVFTITRACASMARGRTAILRNQCKSRSTLSTSLLVTSECAWNLFCSCLFCMASTYLPDFSMKATDEKRVMTSLGGFISIASRNVQQSTSQRAFSCSPVTNSTVLCTSFIKRRLTNFSISFTSFICNRSMSFCRSCNFFRKSSVLSSSSGCAAFDAWRSRLAFSFSTSSTCVVSHATGLL
mmetsp:Transcript_93738/g.185898  ORF Transcript_93738/g.185898 Transcript_93738/m.185898 type:complete len:266 (-) Transcript_93738:458-1255(-)